MQIADTHTHSYFSFDGHDSPEALCEAAVGAGIKILAITDHFDTDGIAEKFYDPYRAAEAKAEIYAAREKFAGKLTLSYGLELGQPYTYPKIVKTLCGERGFDYIIGSLHNLVNLPDFCFLKYEKMPQRLIDSLWERAIDETERLLLGFDGVPVNSLAHLTYPLRYIKRAGRDLDMPRFYGQLAGLYRRLVERGTALEVNASGLRQGAGMTFPDFALVKLYRECGGELVTVGSDAHCARDVGANIKDIYLMLREAGFSHTVYYIEGKPQFIKID